MSKVALAPRRPVKVATAPPFVPLVPICDESIGKQMVEAESKIDTSLTFDAVGDEAQMYAMTTTRLYGDFARAWIWSPNHTDSTCGEQPSGFQFNMSPKSPVFNDPFSQRAMFNGVMAVPILDVPTLTLRFLADRKNRVVERMMAELDSEADLGGSGDDTNFAGIYSTVTRDSQSETTTLWAVTQSHSLAVADQTARLIRDAEPDTTDAVCARTRDLTTVTNQIMLERYERDYCGGTDEKESQRRDKVSEKSPFTTVEELFFKDRHMSQKRAAQREHRARVLAKLLKAASVVSRRLGSGDSLDESARKILEFSDKVEVTFNDVDRVDKADPYSDVVYTSNLISVYDIGTNGAIVRDAPLLGLDVLRGPWDADGVANRQRDAERPFISLPTGGGMRQSNALRFENATPALAKKCASSSSEVWLWTPPTSGDCHFFFDNENIRSRSAERRWLQFESACGFPPTNEKVHLSNVLIRLASPDHKLQHIKRFN